LITIAEIPVFEKYHKEKYSALLHDNSKTTALLLQQIVPVERDWFRVAKH